jgi:hypothetical protein
MRKKTVPMLSAEVDADAGTLKMDFTPAAAVVFRLQWIAAKIPNPSEAERVAAIAEYLQTNLQKLEFLPTRGRKVQIRYTAPEPERERIEAVLAEEVVGRVLAEISRVIKPATQPRKRKQTGLVRIGGHFVDHQLKRPRQLELFSELLAEDEPEPILEQRIIELAKLEFAEKRVLNAVAMLLHQQSGNTGNPESGADYYTGNLPAQRVPYNGESATAPVLIFTVYELAKLIHGEGVGGSDIGKVRGTLEKLAGKKWILHHYYRELRSKDSITVRDTIPIFNILRWQQAERHNAAGEVVKRAEAVVLQLSPLFRDQIADKYITSREDFYPRLAKASGKTTEAEHEFLMYLLREMSAGRRRCEIGQSKLVGVMMLEKVAQQGRAKRLEKAIFKAIETATKMNVISEHSLREGKNERVFCFELNPKWYRKE